MDGNHFLLGWVGLWGVGIGGWDWAPNQITSHHQWTPITSCWGRGMSACRQPDPAPPQADPNPKQKPKLDLGKQGGETGLGEAVQVVPDHQQGLLPHPPTQPTQPQPPTHPTQTTQPLSPEIEKCGRTVQLKP